MRLIPALVFFLVAVAGCQTAAPRGEAVALVLAVGADGACTVEVGGRHFPLAEGEAMEAEMRRLAAGGRRAVVEGSGNTPYRCIGTVIYRAQRAGFTRVGFVAQPAPAP